MTADLWLQFLKRINSGQEIRFLFGSVRDDVVAATGRMQEPHVYSNLGGGQVYLDR
jgi:hypothetical protein